ncbi:enoyl-CoA hydratase [Henriciella algicola]|uniref:Enoyl-CoA hydratase n=1 Tax=Henriciella algicola TaxID=1608422 RepID=A0A399RID9_9PROT|nr:enoyl-CoA hydratase [Henriciella algicola]RIJ31450.1 enoyl-CoA hydratase [Henriciella algicola]
MSEHIKTHLENYVLTITIARPERKNALTQAMYGAMADAVNGANSDKSIRAIVFTGEGDMFTAGNDLSDFASIDERESGTPPVTRFLNAIRDAEKPLIAAVNGPAIGVGLTMLLHCDISFAAESANFRAPFTQLGLVPEAGSSLTLPSVVGRSMANEVLLAGRILSADEALACGLVSRVVADSDLMKTAMDTASKIAASPPNAVLKSKALINHSREQIADQMQAEGRIFAEQLQSAEFAEAAAAFREKRAPVFKD